MSTPLGPAGWHPDPAGRYEYRYYNGLTWTADVSVHGQRFIDPAGPPQWQQGQQQPQQPDRSRGMAVAAFVIGLVSLLAAWIPFVFALAAAGAIAAFVFGIVSLRKSRAQDGHGRGFATAGIVLAVCALLMCIAGFALTKAVLREVDAYLNPGPNTTVIDTCEVGSNRTVTMRGALTNMDTVAHDYTVVVDVLVNGNVEHTETIIVKSLGPDDRKDLETNALVLATGSTTCRLKVYGPTPFGIRQQDLGEN